MDIAAALTAFATALATVIASLGHLKRKQSRDSEESNKYLKRQLSDVRKEIQAVRTQVLELMEEKIRDSAKIAQLMREIAELKSERSVDRSRISALENHVSDLESQVAELERERDLKEQEIVSLKSENDALKASQVK